MGERKRAFGALKLTNCRAAHRSVRADWGGMPPEEIGGTLPASLWALAVGALVMAPFLAQLSTSLLAGREARRELREQYASDAGVEFAIWKLTNDAAFRSSVDLSAGTPVSLSPAPTVNQLATTITVEAVPIGVWTARASLPGNINGGGALAWDQLRPRLRDGRRYALRAYAARIWHPIVVEVAEIGLNL